MCLFILYVNEHDLASPFGFVNSYILIAFVVSCRYNKLSLFDGLLFWIGGKVIRRQDPLEWAWTKTANYKNTVCYILQGKKLILESVAKSLLRINTHTSTNVFLYLCFQLRIMYVKNIYVVPLSSFYTVRILSTKFQGYCHAAYQQIVVYTGDFSTRMDFDRLCISVCKTLVVNEKCIF